MICDSNVTKLDTNYSEFIKGIEDQTLCITSGWYRGSHNNIVAELNRSLNQPDGVIILIKLNNGVIYFSPY